MLPTFWNVPDLKPLFCLKLVCYDDSSNSLEAKTAAMRTSDHV